MDPDNTKGHGERPLDFSPVLFPRHTLTHTLSVTSPTRPWHLGHLSASGASLPLTAWHGTEVGHRWHREVCSPFAVTSETDARVISPVWSRDGMTVSSQVASALAWQLSITPHRWRRICSLSRWASKLLLFIPVTLRFKQIIRKQQKKQFPASSTPETGGSMAHWVALPRRTKSKVVICSFSVFYLIRAPISEQWVRALCVCWGYGQDTGSYWPCWLLRWLNWRPFSLVSPLCSRSIYTITRWTKHRSSADTVKGKRGWQPAPRMQRVGFTTFGICGSPSWWWSSSHHVEVTLFVSSSEVVISSGLIRDYVEVWSCE